MITEIATLFSSKIQPLCHHFQFIISNPQISLGVYEALMIELVHNQRQIHTLQAGVIAPGFSQAVSAIVALQPNITAGRNHNGIPPKVPNLYKNQFFGAGQSKFNLIV
jgi:hypothetical protein